MPSPDSTNLLDAPTIAKIDGKGMRSQTIEMLCGKDCIFIFYYNISSESKGEQFWCNTLEQISYSQKGYSGS